MLTKRQINTQLRWEHGPNYRDILRMSSVMRHMLNELRDGGHDYSYRVYTTEYKKGQEYRDVDIRLYDCNVSSHDPVFSTGTMPEGDAYLTMIGKLQTLREEEEKQQARRKAWGKRFSTKGSYAEKMQRRFL